MFQSLPTSPAPLTVSSKWLRARTDPEFLAFDVAWIGAVVPYLCRVGVFGTFIDWRHWGAVSTAALQLGLTPLNLVVWSKTNAGMGSLYRSKHELLTLSTKGGAPSVNNVGLGKNGRSRSNVWVYPGASSLGSDGRRGLQEHPTAKPVPMLKDALLDLTNRGDLVIDPFLGSGSTLIAAEHTGRQCRAPPPDWPFDFSSANISAANTMLRRSWLRGA